MSSAIEVDFISPMNSTAVTLESCALIPTVATHIAVATTVTLHMTSVTIGKIVTLSIDTVTFSGSGATVTTSAVSTMTAPAENCYIPLITVSAGTLGVGYLELSTAKIITLTGSGGGFNGASAIYGATLSYTIA